jgi:serine protease Do
MLERAAAGVVQVRVGRRGAGTGIVVNRDGGVLTNYHVVGDGRWPVEVILADGRKAPAEIVRTQPATDLALLRIAPGGLQPVIFGDSSSLRVGELVFAVGHPWSLPSSASAGIVSALGEVPVRWGGLPAEYIRSDVLLGPGNSGGPLLNAAGEVVGVNAMILGGDLSVAIPIHVVRRWLALPDREAEAAAAS